MEEWRDTVGVGGEVAQMAAAWRRSSEEEGDLLVSEVGVLRRRKKKRAATRVESAETQDQWHRTENGGGG